MTTMRYEVRVAGRMSDRACSAFRDMTVVPVDPETVIYGDVTDDAQLHGLLALCQDLGLRVVAVREALNAAVLTNGSTLSAPVRNRR
ncbi:MAG: hypothetical protein K0R87_125 [Pseudonocardia sp.]|nr:hypothetical protein [Pseudonocardia sp.]